LCASERIPYVRLLLALCAITECHHHHHHTHSGESAASQKILIGAEGRTVRQMTENAIETLQELLGRPVKLSISVVLEEARR